MKDGIFDLVAQQRASHNSWLNVCPINNLTKNQINKELDLQKTQKIQHPNEKGHINQSIRLDPGAPCGGEKRLVCHNGAGSGA